MSHPIHLYTGHAANYARIAAHWLSRLAEWERTTGRAAAKCRKLCRSNHVRTIKAAKAEL